MAVVMAVLVLIAPSPGDGKSTMKVAPQTRKTAVVFALAGEAEAEFRLDPVVVVDGKQLRGPYLDEDKDKQRFGEEYFKEGRTYRMTFGGGEAGSVTVKKWSVGCTALHAAVGVSTTVRLGGNVNALATSSASFGKRPSARRAPTETERAQVLALVKSIYSQKGTPANLIPSIKVTNLTATDLEGDGNYEFIGSFTLTARSKFERDLFLIARPQGSAMRGEFVKFQAYQPPPEGFLSGIDFVDHLDIDGDGIGEVFAMQGGFDAYQYVIFKKVGRVWKRIFDSAGDAC
jgi:hypothetical protein